MSSISTGSKQAEAPASQIATSIQISSDSAHVFKVRLAEEMDGEIRDSIWALFEANMRVMYTASSFGWDPPTKRAELFNPLTRFVLVRGAGALVAFAAFRFEFEDGENILYCYDLQVASAVRRQGLGRVLMQHLTKIGQDFKLRKLMLTVFESNTPARRFYESIGFQLDRGSPGDEDDEDYRIMYKTLNVA
uniref:N-alpha-acetyltransferase 40 n=1 Tax=Mycena chlorophos TaxID=658473 RepID=A0ABQ0LUZ0_MYCCL|nr:predicted protein [Mycena chlorophos]